MYENRVYTERQSTHTELPMSKYANDALATFGQRLAQLRKAAGYTQQELADEIGVTRRMIAYYETESEHPPANLLVDLTTALNVSADELLGIKKLKKKAAQSDTRLQRRVQQIEKMDTAQKRQIVQLLDALIEREQLKQNAK